MKWEPSRTQDVLDVAIKDGVKLRYGKDGNTEWWEWWKRNRGIVFQRTGESLWCFFFISGEVIETPTIPTRNGSRLIVFETISQGIEFLKELGVEVRQ